MPADVFFPVRGQVDLRGALVGRFLPVAFPAEVPTDRLGRLDDPRRDPVSGRYVVARGALELDVVGHRERPRDLAVARRTLRGTVGGFGSCGL